MIGARSIPLAESASFRRPARRTAVVRLALGSALALVGAAAILSARRLDIGESAVFASGNSGIVVLDLSSSIDSVPAPEIGIALRRIADGHGRAGLVLFSDVAYEALPSSAASSELRSYLRFFRQPPEPDTRRAQLLPRGRRARRTVTPWTRSFRGGTRISGGLQLARRMIHEHPGRTHDVLLVSDLKDSLFDLGELTTALLQYRQDGIRLRVIAVGATEENRDFFSKRLGHGIFVPTAELTRPPRRQSSGDTPGSLIALAVVLAFLLGVNELACGRLDWSRA